MSPARQVLRTKSWRGLGSLGVLALLGTLASSAAADVEAHRVLELGAGRVVAGLSGRAVDAPHEVIVEVEQSARILELGLTPLSAGRGVFVGSSEEVLALGRQAGVTRVRWSPWRHLLLDLADPQVGATGAREDHGVDGDGVVVGVVDTGIDISHSAFRRADGSSRIAWFLSYGQSPQGLHPELEEAYGCVANDDCAVFSAANIDEALASGNLGGFPRDSIGHGTHLASIAAGIDPEYGGIAPGAELVVVQVAGASGLASDARIVEGCRFVFDRAAEQQKPAVANISLGSGFGAHDGSSALEESLSELGSGPGRAIVVASGNDGDLLATLSDDYPAPFGLHSEIFVHPDTPKRVPILTPPVGTDQASGSFFVWISTSAGDDISVAFSNGQGELTDPIAPGESGAATSEELGDSDDYELLIVNGVDDDLEVGVLPGSAVFGLSGQWSSGRTFELVLTGSGTARMWVESSGAVGRGSTATGVVFPGARSSGTVNVPATSLGVIAVGASVNRESWTDHTGELVEQALGEVSSRVGFSGAGPSQGGRLKPDVIAPGGNVIAAMAESADPRSNPEGGSQFASHGRCDSGECFVVDDAHGVAAGTSMAAPVATGAVALLFQRDPTLTAEEIRRLLRAGSSLPVEGESDAGRSGAGLLDIDASLRALDSWRASEVTTPSEDYSRLVFAGPFAYPDPKMSLDVIALLRDEQDAPIGGDLLDRLSVRVDGPGSARLLDAEAGLARLELRAEPQSAGQTLELQLLLDGETFLSESLPIEADSILARGGVELTGGTCAHFPARRSSGFLVFALFLPALLLRRRRPS